jgi:8-oxo-dGTP pyrophosphatase MutT (NUDIX family)
MPHIHTEPGQHDHTISALIFRVDFKEPKVLLHRHKTLKRYMQFGGHIELDENPWQTLVRELREEAGYDIAQLQLLQPPKRITQFGKGILHPIPLSYGTFIYTDISHFHTDTNYAFVATEKPAHAPAPGESTDLQLFNQAELLAMPDTLLLANVRELCVFAAEECLPNWERVDPQDFTPH